MFVKICGLQTTETLDAAVAAGADAVGFVFAPGSARTVTAEQAATLRRAVPASVETVGVFRDQPLAEVLRLATRAGLSSVQLHGAEPLPDMARLRQEGFAPLRAFSAAAYAALPPAERLAWDAERLLIDAPVPGAGETFDLASLHTGTPAGFWLLAGGLTVANVAALARAAGPNGVDVSSGVESRRGVKDPALIRAFIAAARTP